MKVMIDSHIYNSKDTLIAVVLTEDEKEMIESEGVEEFESEEEEEEAEPEEEAEEEEEEE